MALSLNHVVYHITVAFLMTYAVVGIRIENDKNSFRVEASNPPSGAPSRHPKWNKDNIEPSFKQIQSVLEFKRKGMWRTLCKKSIDNCSTVDHFFHSHWELSYKMVTKVLAEIPELYSNGSIRKGNDLGEFQLNGRLWKRDPYLRTIALGAPVEVHKWVRPILDGLMGNASPCWSKAKIRRHVREFLSGRTEFDTAIDGYALVTSMLHEFFLGIKLNSSEIKHFVNWQAKLPLFIVVPKWAYSIDSRLLDFREKMINKYMIAIEKAYEANSSELPIRSLFHDHGVELNDQSKHLLAHGILDALAFAGGLSVPMVLRVSLAVIHARKSPLKEQDRRLKDFDAVQKLVWEVVRRYAPVIAFSFWDSNMTARTVLGLGMALRDPAVWGDDANDFKLRDIRQYAQYGPVAWGAQSNFGGPNSRGCPAQDLSYNIVAEFLDEWRISQSEWIIPSDTVAFTDYNPWASDFRLRRGLSSDWISVRMPAQQGGVSRKLHSVRQINSLFEFKSKGMRRTLCKKSIDNCSTVDNFFNSHWELSYNEVTKILAEIPDLYSNESIKKGNDLGEFQLSRRLWKRDPYLKTIALGAPVEEHKWVRPILDGLMGAASPCWNKGKIRRHVREFLTGRTEFDTATDTFSLVAVMLHEFFLGIKLSSSEVKDFVNWQWDLPYFIVMPSWTTSDGHKLDFRDKMLERYKIAIERAYAANSSELPIRSLFDVHGVELNDRSKHLLAHGILDALAFAGGLSVPMVLRVSLAVVYARKSPLKAQDRTLKDFDAVQKLVWEVVRRYAPVIAFSFWDSSMTKRTILGLGMALRDPAVWGNDADDFKLRDISKYSQYGPVAWGAQSNAAGANSRGCPAQDLSFSIATEFLDEWRISQSEWIIISDKVEFTDYNPWASDFLLARGQWLQVRGKAVFQQNGSSSRQNRDLDGISRFGALARELPELLKAGMSMTTHKIKKSQKRIKKRWSLGKKK